MGPFKAIIARYPISGSVSDVNHNKIKNHKNSTLQIFFLGEYGR